MRIGVIADDFTGASDIAGFLVAGGMKTIMYNGIPIEQPPSHIDAMVISLKIRSCPAEEAVEQALQSLQFLKAQGCTKYYYKYCSTFDSTREGTIGPVVDALMENLKTDLTIICPSLPINGRTVCHGYLFVGHDLLSDSSMRHHPLTPMTDAKLSRLMEGQFSGTTGHVYYPTIAQGAAAVGEELQKISKTGHRYAVVDTLNDEDLTIIAEATEDMVLVTGGSGLAIGITAVQQRHTPRSLTEGSAFIPTSGPGVVISGSCSKRTNEQVDYYKGKAASHKIEEGPALSDPVAYAKELAQWVLQNLENKYAPMIYATKSPEELEQSRKQYGDANVAAAIEEVIGLVVELLAANGVRNYISAGGETSGVVATTLGLQAYLIGPQIDPGVSWLKALESDLQFSFKSGNFGELDFFTKAQDMYAEDSSVS